MRKRHIALLMAFSLVLTSAAWGAFKVQAGAALANLNFSQDLGKQKALVQPAGGLGFEFGLARILAVEVSLMYVPGGCRFEREIGTLTYEGAALAIPLLVKLRLGTGSTPFLGAGAGVGYVLTSKIKYAYDWASGEMDLKDDVNRLQYALVFNAGYELALGSMALSLEVRYQRGLSNMVKDPLPGESVRTSTLTALVGYSF